MKETHFKIVHKIYPVNFNVCKYLYIERSCSFCKQAEETLVHLFLGPRSMQFWSDLGSHIFDSANVVHSFSLKYIIFDYDNTKNKPLEHTIIFLFYIFCFIYKQKIANSYPSYPLLKMELNSLLKCLRLIKNKTTKITEILYRGI